MRRYAQQTRLEVGVRGGGHNYAGAAVPDGGLCVDLRAMNRVAVDPVARRARCGGGALQRELDAAAQEHGLAVTGGTISHQHGVGVDHLPYVADEKGSAGVGALKQLCSNFDPENRMNPGKLVT